VRKMTSAISIVNLSRQMAEWVTQEKVIIAKK
jgi:hypothetical protein